MRRRPTFASIADVPLWRSRAADDQRASPRLVCAPGQMVALAARGGRWLVPVYNLSDGGLMIRLPAKLALGERVTVAFGRGRVLSARICWMDGMRAGLAFEGAAQPD
jgi:hypothetical protein